MHRMKIFCALAAIGLSLLGRSEDDYLLYWRVLDTDKVDGTLISDFVAADASRYSFDHGTPGQIFGARAVVYSGNGESALMAMYEPNKEEERWVFTGYNDTPIRLDNGSMPSEVPGYSYFTAITPNELSFAIELGNWENGNWVTLAVSDRVSYNDLTVTSSDGHYHVLEMIDSNVLHAYHPWSPQTYSVPEPSSGLLALLGASLLALRRRRR